MSQTIGHVYSGGEQQQAADRFRDLGGNAILYSYPNGDYDIICAAERLFLPPGWESAEDFSRQGRNGPAPAKREKGKKSEGDDQIRSMRRARAKLRRMALANQFDWFVTLTLDKEKIDRYDPKAIMQKVNRWLDNMVRRHGLRYILVPERHKDGAIHFHGFFAGPGLQAVESGVRHSEHMIYNLPQWGFGFTAAMELYGEYSSAVGYVCKYIGKQEGERPMGRWYYSGGDLKDPPKEYTMIEYRDLMDQFPGEAVEIEIPGTKMIVVHHRENQPKVDKKGG